MAIYTCDKQNIITIMKGSTYSDTITLTNVAGEPVDLTGYTARSQVRTITGRLVFSFTCEIPAPTTGVVIRTASAADTALATPANPAQNVWGLELTAGDATLPEAQGGVIVLQEVVI